MRQWNSFTNLPKEEGRYRVMIWHSQEGVAWFHKDKNRFEILGDHKDREHEDVTSWTEL